MCCSEYHVGLHTPASLNMFETCCQTKQHPKPKRLLNLIFTETIGPVAEGENVGWVCYVHHQGSPVEDIELELRYFPQEMDVRGTLYSSKQGLVTLRITPKMDFAKININVDISDHGRLKEFTHVQFNSHPERDLERQRELIQKGNERKNKLCHLEGLKKKVVQDLKATENRLTQEIQQAIKDLG